ncbi:L-threonylcarbamoyladenylate synthase [Paeniglutamicibacter antarcticus]|uniref:L-threonylcarbamoyladenylate synthase n=1 Tax=Paeniglutamicibacter antarcticus TaxID=494023 RepID=A0ABP9TMR9_9MICC
MTHVTSRFDARDPQELEAGLEAARAALAQSRCVVMPTDTVYGIAADAFSSQAVATLLAAKGRGRSMPPPVLIAQASTLDGLAVDVPAGARKLADEFWPGALTLILHAQPSLAWDLGETRGTVALRVPDDEVARALLRATGPLAVSSANRTGTPAGATAAAAFEQLGETVEVYLEDGARPVSGEALSSTIIDCTLDPPRIVRVGALSLEALRAVIPELLDSHGQADPSITADSTADSLLDGSGPDGPVAETDRSPGNDGTEFGAPETDIVHESGSDLPMTINTDAQGTDVQDTDGQDGDGPGESARAS